MMYVQRAADVCPWGKDVFRVWLRLFGPMWPVLRSSLCRSQVELTLSGHSLCGAAPRVGICGVEKPPHTVVLVPGLWGVSRLSFWGAYGDPVPHAVLGQLLEKVCGCLAGRGWAGGGLPSTLMGPWHPDRKNHLYTQGGTRKHCTLGCVLGGVFLV